MADEEKKKTKIDLNNLKSGGFIKERGRDLFTVRLRVPGGRMPVAKLKKIVEVTEGYGADFVHLSVRQSIELVHVPFGKFDEITEALGEKGQKIASCGARVRVPVACGGCEYNPNGLVDTQKAAHDVDEQLFGIDTSHKFKVTFSGCPMDCPKAATIDLGFVGAAYPAVEADKCISCGLCVKSCTEGALKFDGNKKPVLDISKCIYCGDCIKVCPTSAWIAEKTGYTVYAGGKWGRHPLVGTPVADFVPEGRVIEFIQVVLEWYRENAVGLGRIRLGDVITRTGVQPFLAKLRVNFGELVRKDTHLPIEAKAGGRE
ncbi:MAG TPA: 4Fe-4S dicluster domain-containing protein [Nitrospirota bacterium]|jgi:dissimilatory sulfite reductase (desulfoviridin) alpha/beta subunit